MRKEKNLKENIHEMIRKCIDENKIMIEKHIEKIVNKVLSDIGGKSLEYCKEKVM